MTLGFDTTWEDLWTSDASWETKAREAVDGAEVRGAPDHLVRGWRRRIAFVLGAAGGRGSVDYDQIAQVWREAEGWGRDPAEAPRTIGESVVEGGEAISRGIDATRDLVAEKTPWWVWGLGVLAVAVGVAYVVRTARGG